MTKNKGKTVLAIFVAALAAVLPFVAEGAVFNNDPLDNPTLEAVNYTNNPNCDTCWATYVSANAGEVISFLIYYHNNSNETATSTKVKLDLPVGPFTYASVLGSIWAQNAPAATGNVSVSLTSSRTLAFVPGSARWYVWDWYDPARNKTLTNLPGGQNGSEIISSGGLDLANTASHWGGYVVARFQVSSSTATTTAPTVSTNPASSIGQNSATLNGSVNPNNAATNAWFEWGTTTSLGNFTSQQSIGAGNASVNYSAAVSGLSPNTTYYFRAAAQNAGGTAYGSIMSFTTQIQPPQGFAPTVNAFFASPVSQNSATLNGSVNPNNAATNAWFEWGTTSSVGNSTPSQSMGGGSGAVNYSYSLSGLSAGTTYYFRAAASNSFGTSYSTTLIFTTPGQSGSAPTVYTNSATSVSQNSAMLNGSANPNGSFATAWFEYGTSAGSLVYSAGLQSMGSGIGSLSYSTNLSGLSPNTTYYYRAVANNSYGTAYGSVLSFTTGSSGYVSPPTYGTAPLVITSPASLISRNAALLNGSVNPNGALTTGWFEWGTTASLGNRTASYGMGSNFAYSPLAFALTGLSPNAAYYFRAAAQNPYGTSYGSVLSFTTLSDVIVTPALTPPTVITQRVVERVEVAVEREKKPLVVLLPAVDNNEVTSGEEINYTVVYRNGDTKPIKDAVLRITLPLEVEYLSANREFSERRDNVLQFNLGEIGADGQGAVAIRGRVKELYNGGTLIYGATLDYTDSAGKFQSVSAYISVTVKPLERTSLLASLLDLFGNWWLWLILLLAVLAFLLYRYYLKRKASAFPAFSPISGVEATPAATAAPTAAPIAPELSESQPLDTGGEPAKMAV